ncbi:proline and serine-rich protein 3 [Pantherophis guttatus]|uniref:Proline and serine-rich protein 3 n=1 Tax=Pantherophis guttatus TaxID=94885 RepID=A0A6P9C7Y3_PANGU|nr:proline and serine-rich protein 3 [Pantherophis guttatus]XP_034279544.1 proline and serine-rich protein 3 [Pantherophis guttatus]XP_034279545.1 proline and serine-rich protein 3 [Pantherophis guttatus]XP_034279546.1 proline and serine-rich protein 3 [Pantherophis guttatus]
MDSSLAVFCTLGSPFLEASSSRSHYHPSQAQPLRQKKQQTVLSPSRLQHKKCSVLPEEPEPLSASSPHLLPDSSSHEGKPPKSNSTSPFNESWPSTEHSSSSLTSEGKKDLPAQHSSEAKTLDAQKLPDSASDSESIIAKYIERFRYGKPTDRKERLASSGGSTEFWWLSHSFLPDGEYSKKEASLSSDSSQSEVRSSLFSPILTQTALGEMQAATAFDAETVSLQERAARVISRSISPLSSFRPVSSEGFDSTATSTNPNSTPDLPQHALQHPAAHQVKESLVLPYHTTPSSNIAHSLKPEDDILFQWRLRRKMEEASKVVAAMPPEVWRNLCFQPTCASGKMEREVLKSTEPTPRRDTDQKVLSTSESHLDIKYTQSQCHPCSCAGMLRNGVTSGQRIEIISPSNGIVVTGGSEGRDEPIVKDPTPQKDHIPDYLETSPSRPAKANESLGQTTSRHVQRTAPSDQGMHLELSRRSGLCRDKQSQAKPIPDPRQSTRSPTKHSVQHVLSEVVAERLFFPPDSPALPRDKPKRSSRTLGPEKAIPKNAVTPTHPQLLNMAAQLLEQAEDSDGLEFEDDPLLQVLRGQRESLRNELRAVDFQITQMESNSFDQGVSHR